MTMTTWLLIPAIVLCFLALWIVLPPFHAGLLPLAVGAPELSPWLLLASLGICALTFQAASVLPAARAAFTVAAIAAILSAYPARCECRRRWGNSIDRWRTDSAAAISIGFLR